MADRKEKAKELFLRTTGLGKVIQASLNRHNVPASHVSDSMLPDDFVFEGSKVVNGKFCKTVWEYKEALDKDDKDLGSWGW